jgi:hypothetical protein
LEGGEEAEAEEDGAEETEPLAGFPHLFGGGNE